MSMLKYCMFQMQSGKSQDTYASKTKGKQQVSWNQKNNNNNNNNKCKGVYVLGQASIHNIKHLMVWFLYFQNFFQFKIEGFLHLF